MARRRSNEGMDTKQIYSIDIQSIDNHYRTFLLRECPLPGRVHVALLQYHRRHAHLQSNRFDNHQSKINGLRMCYVVLTRWRWTRSEEGSFRIEPNWYMKSPTENETKRNNVHPWNTDIAGTSRYLAQILHAEYSLSIMPISYIVHIQNSLCLGK